MMPIVFEVPRLLIAQIDCASSGGVPSDKRAIEAAEAATAVTEFFELKLIKCERNFLSQDNL